MLRIDCCGVDDDLTGILTTVGVWGALLLSILVGLLSSMPKDHLDVGDIRYGIIYNDLVCGPLLDFLDGNGSLRRRAGVPLDDHACFPYPAQLSLRADLNLSGSRLAAIERLKLHGVIGRCGNYRAFERPLCGD